MAGAVVNALAIARINSVCLSASDANSSMTTRSRLASHFLFAAAKCRCLSSVRASVRHSALTFARDRIYTSTDAAWLVYNIGHIRIVYGIKAANGEMIMKRQNDSASAIKGRTPPSRHHAVAYVGAHLWV